MTKQIRMLLTHTGGALLIVTAPALTQADEQARITGTVTDNRGNPIPKASLNVEGLQFQATTNEKGEYSIRYVPGTFRITVSAPNHLKKQVSYNIAQPANVPAAPVKLPTMPDVSQWQTYLSSQLPEQSVQAKDFYGFGRNVETHKFGQFVSVGAVAVDGFEQTGELEVTGRVTATYQAKMNIESDSRAAESFNSISGFKHGYREGQSWKHHFRIKLVFQEPNTWTWTDSSPTNEADEPLNTFGRTAPAAVIQQKKYPKLIVGKWQGDKSRVLTFSSDGSYAIDSSDESVSTEHAKGAGASKEPN